MKICKENKCNNVVLARELCRTHYLRLWKKKLLLNLRIVNPNRGCVIYGCNNKHYAKNLCSYHYGAKDNTGKQPTKKQIWAKEQQGKYFCQCGCGETIKITTTHFKQRPIPRFLPKHCWSYVGKLRIGKPRDENTKKRLSEFKLKEYADPSNHPRWRGGISFFPYPIGFNRKLKFEIKERDNHKCQLCGVPQEECVRILDVHHIDHNKENLSKENLITLCRKCNTKANSNIKYWENYFKIKVANYV